jgi:hypothetical protein
VLPLIAGFPQPITSAIGIIAAVGLTVVLVVCIAGVLILADPRRMVAAGAGGMLALALLLLVIGSSNLVLDIVVALLGACLLSLLRAIQPVSVPADSLVSRRSLAGAIVAVAVFIALADAAVSTRWPPFCAGARCAPVGPSIEGIGQFFGSQGLVAVGMTAIVLFASIAAFAVLMAPAPPERYVPTEPFPRPRRRTR